MQTCPVRLPDTHPKNELFDVYKHPQADRNNLFVDNRLVVNGLAGNLAVDKFAAEFLIVACGPPIRNGARTEVKEVLSGDKAHWEIIRASGRAGNCTRRDAKLNPAADRAEADDRQEQRGFQYYIDFVRLRARRPIGE